MEEALKIWKIVLWAGPIIGAIFYFIVNNKIKLKERGSKGEKTNVSWTYIKWIALIIGAIFIFIVNF